MNPKPVTKSGIIYDGFIVLLHRMVIYSPGVVKLVPSDSVNLKEVHVC